MAPRRTRGRPIVSAAPVRKKSNNNFAIGIGIGALAGLGAIWWLTQKKPAAPPPVALPTVADTMLAKQAKGYEMGKPDAPVHIMEFGDFECPGCGRFATITEPDIRSRLIETGQVRFTFYDYPLVQLHKHTMVAHMAAACAEDQGKFWPMHDKLFETQYEWSGVVTDNPRKVIDAGAEAVGLNMQTWKQCMETRPHETRIKANYAYGLNYVRTGTPTFIINGVEMKESPSYDAIKTAVDEALRVKQAASAPIPAAAP
jgi:protein-disulfide isomerase